MPVEIVFGSLAEVPNNRLGPPPGAYYGDFWVGQNYGFDVCEDNSGNIHVVGMRRDASAYWLQQGMLVYMRRNVLSGTWSVPIDLIGAWVPSGVGADAVAIVAGHRIAADAQGNLMVIGAGWFRTPPNDWYNHGFIISVYYNKATDTWEEPQELGLARTYIAIEEGTSLVAIPGGHFVFALGNQGPYGSEQGPVFLKWTRDPEATPGVSGDWTIGPISAQPSLDFNTIFSEIAYIDAVTPSVNSTGQVYLACGDGLSDLYSALGNTDPTLTPVLAVYRAFADGDSPLQSVASESGGPHWRLALRAPAARKALGTVASATLTTVVLASGGNFGAGDYIKITGGPGAGQIRLINSWNAPTLTATVPQWDVIPIGSESTYEVRGLYGPEAQQYKIVANRKDPTRADIVAFTNASFGGTPGAWRQDMLLHVTLIDGIPGEQQTLWSVEGDQAYGHPRVPYNGNIEWLDLRSDFNGDLHLVYGIEEASNNYIYYYRRLTFGSREWSDPVRWNAGSLGGKWGWLKVAVPTKPTSQDMKIRGFSPIYCPECFDPTYAYIHILTSSECESCAEPPPPPLLGSRDDRCPELPEDWQRVLANPMGARIAAQVIYDPDGEAPIDLSPYLLTMRPYTVRKDTELRNFVADDAELVFADEENRFLPSFPGSVFYDSSLSDNQTGWMFKELAVLLRAEDFEGWTEDLPVFRGLIIDITNAPGTATIRLGNAFKRLLDRKIKPNGCFSARTIRVDLVEADKSVGIFRINDGVDVYVDVNTDIAHFQTWTIEFVEVTTAPVTYKYRVTGSVSGEQSTPGFTHTDYTSDNGELSIDEPAFDPLDPVLVPPQERWKVGDKIAFVAGMGLPDPILAAPDNKFDVFQAMKEVLLRNYGANLASTGRVNEGEFNNETNSGSTLKVAFVFDEEIPVLDVMQQLGWHANATVVENSNGTIGVLQYRPLSARDACYLCSSNSIMDAPGITRSQIVNEFELKYDYRAGVEGEFAFQAVETYPATQSEVDNPSFAKYKQLVRRTIEFRGFSAADASFARTAAAYLYAQFSDRRELVEVKLKVENINIELSTMARLVIDQPPIAMLAEPIELRKEVSEQHIGPTVIFRKATWFLSDTCGVLHVGSGRYDDCFVWG
jgi:hypothetical protein